MQRLVDIEFYRGKDGEQVAKEMSMCDMVNNCVATWIFLPPCDWSELPPEIMRHNSDLQRQANFIPWEQGTVPYSQLSGILNSIGPVFTVRGSAQRHFLKMVLGTKLVVDLERMGCPRAKKIAHPQIDACTYLGHSSTDHLRCTHNKAVRYACWYTQMQTSSPQLQAKPAETG